MKLSIHSALGVLLFALLALLPASLYSAESIADSFSHEHAAIAELQMRTPQPDFFSGTLRGIPSFTVLIIILDNLLGVTNSQLEFMIVLGLIFPIQMLALSRLWIRQSWTIAAAVALMPIFNFFPAYYSVWPHGWGFALLLTALLVLSTTDTYRVQKLAILSAIVLVLGFFSYTGELWLLGILSVFAAVEFARRRYVARLAVQGFAAGLLLILIVRVFSFNQIFYSRYLPNLREDVKGDFAIERFLGRYLSFLPGVSNNIEPVPYAYISPSPVYLTSLNAIYLSVLVLIIATATVWAMVQLVRRPAMPSRAAVLALALAVVVPLDLGAYGMIGTVFLRSILFVGPIALMLLLAQVAPSTTLRVAAISLVCIAAAGFILTYHYGDHIGSADGYAGIDRGATWIAAHVDSEAKLLTDHHSGGRLRLAYAAHGQSFTQWSYTPALYAAVIGNGEALDETPIQYVVINVEQAQHRILTLDWGDLMPIGPHISAARDVVGRDVIYDSARLTVMER